MTNIYLVNIIDNQADMLSGTSNNQYFLFLLKIIKIEQNMSFSDQHKCFQTFSRHD